MLSAALTQPLYALPITPAVKWLVTQERNLNRELSYPELPTETPEEYVSRTYLQFLWLPLSIMPLQSLIPALLRVTTTPTSPSTNNQPHAQPQAQSAVSRPFQLPAPASHPLHDLLKPILLTSRAASQKYHSRIAQVLAEEGEPSDAEEEYIWYAFQKDKVGEDAQAENDQEVEERLKSAWLEKFERREVQIQILFYFLLISLPSVACAIDEARSVCLPLPSPLTPSKSKKRRRKEDRGRERGAAADPPPPLEERLESYMDKLAMWQLMHTVNSSLPHATAPAPSTHGKGKGKEKDDRDWMQVFCEDVVEPLFKEKLPELCALFHSKLFPDPGNSDTDSLGLTPPVSPKPAAKRLKSTSSVAPSSSGATAKAKSKKEREMEKQQARSRSLSQSLEQEKRERSRSLSIGPNHLRKRATMFEVTMTTKFGKARAKQKAELERTTSQPAPPPGPSLARTQSQQLPVGVGSAGCATEKDKEKALMGSVLVAATPVKPRTEMARIQSQSQSQRTQSQSQARLPALFVGTSKPKFAHASSPRIYSQGSMSRVDSISIDTDEEEEDVNVTPTKARRVPTLPHISEHEGDNEGDEWKLSSSPDVLLLEASGSWQDLEMTASGDEHPPESSSPENLGGLGTMAGPILVGETPTKPKGR